MLLHAFLSEEVSKVIHASLIDAFKASLHLLVSYHIHTYNNKNFNLVTTPRHIYRVILCTLRASTHSKVIKKFCHSSANIRDLYAGFNLYMDICQNIRQASSA